MSFGDDVNPVVGLSVPRSCENSRHRLTASTRSACAREQSRDVLRKKPDIFSMSRAYSASMKPVHGRADGPLIARLEPRPVLSSGCETSEYENEAKSTHSEA